MAPLSAPRLPRERGGWWHAYVCGVHGVELAHDGLLSGAFPAEGARCPYGCRLDTPAVRGAWAALAHQACARRIRLLAAVSPAQALPPLIAYGERYAELTSGGRHEQAQPWMLRGRMFHQALSEAIWAVSLGHAAWTLAEHEIHGLDPLLPLLDSLERAAREARATLVAQDRFTSNYTAWLNAAGAVTAHAAALIRSGTTDAHDGGRGGTTDAHEARGSTTHADEIRGSTTHAHDDGRGGAADAHDDGRGGAADADDGGRGGTAGADWLEGPYGLHAHVLAAVAPDGWEWEASTYYHGFVLRAYLLQLRGTRPGDLPDAVAARLLGMIAALAGTASPGGVLPALHDGPYDRPATAAEHAELGVLAAGFAAPDHLAAVTARAVADAGPGHDRLESGLSGWFAGPPRAAVPPGTRFPDAGLAVLRAGGVHAVLDYGPHGGSHGHHDKLALYLYGEHTPWQPDPGQVPYAEDRWRAYFAGPDAHPAPGLPGLEPAETTGTLDADDPGRVTASCDDAYPGVRLTRTVLTGSGYLADLCALAPKADEPVVLRLRPGVPVEAAEDDGVVTTVWRGEEELRGLHVADAPAMLSAFPAPGLADDPQRARTCLDWAARGPVTFCSVYQAAGAEPAVLGVGVADGVLRVTLTDGAVEEHHLPRAGRDAEEHRLPSTGGDAEERRLPSAGGDAEERRLP
ncbi:heparinase II/III family protein [Nonomuraea sp. NPDC055795]